MTPEEAFSKLDPGPRRYKSRVAKEPDEKPHDPRADKPAASEEAGYLTVEETANYLRVSRNTTYKMIKESSILSVRIGRPARVNRHELDNALRESRAHSSRIERTAKHTHQSLPQ